MQTEHYRNKNNHICVYLLHNEGSSGRTRTSRDATTGASQALCGGAGLSPRPCARRFGEISELTLAIKINVNQLHLSRWLQLAIILYWFSPVCPYVCNQSVINLFIRSFAIQFIKSQFVDPISI